MDLQTWLNQPIPRKQALAGVLLANGGILLMYIDKVRALKNAAEVYADQEQRIAIFKETTDFLLDRADGATVTELDSHLDYWRIIRGVER